jgi:hypothetical protein
LQLTFSLYACSLLLRQLDVALNWRDSLSACAAQNAGVSGAAARFRNKARSQNSRQDAQCLVDGAILIPWQQFLATSYNKNMSKTEK